MAQALRLDTRTAATAGVAGARRRAASSAVASGVVCLKTDPVAVVALGVVS